MRHIKKALLLVFFAPFASLGAPAPASSQESKITPQTIQDVAGVSANFQKLYVSYMELFSTVDQMNTMFYGILDGKVDKEFAKNQTKILLIDCKTRLNRLGQEADNLRYEHIKIANFYSFYADFKDYLKRVHSFLDDSCKENAELIYNFAPGLPIDHAMIWRKTYSRLKLLLNGENRILLGSLFLVPDQHPQKNLTQLSMDTNDIVSELLDALNSWSQGQGDENFSAHLRTAASKTVSARNNLAMGKEQQSLMRLRIGKSGTSTINNVLNTYDKSFAIEQKILDVFEQTIKEFPEKVHNMEDISVFWENEFAKISLLINDRIQIDIERKTLISQNGLQ